MVHPDSSRSVLARLTTLAALLAVLGLAWGSVASTHRRRRDECPGKLPEREQVWEGEGGQNQMPELP